MKYLSIYRCQNLGTLVTWQLAATGRQGPAGHPTLHLLLHKHCHNIVCTTSGTGLWGSTRPARRPQVIHKLCKLSTNYPQIIYPLHDLFHHLSHQVGQDELVNVHCSWQSPLCSHSQNPCCLTFWYDFSQVYSPFESYFLLFCQNLTHSDKLSNIKDS